MPSSSNEISLVTVLLVYYCTVMAPLYSYLDKGRALFQLDLLGASFCMLYIGRVGTIRSGFGFIALFYMNFVLGPVPTRPCFLNILALLAARNFLFTGVSNKSLAELYSAGLCSSIMRGVFLTCAVDAREKLLLFWALDGLGLPGRFS